MKLYKNLLIAGGLLFAILMLGIGFINAGGFLAVRSTGIPYKWDDSAAIGFNPDLGVLGMLSNTEAVNLAASNFQLWGSPNIVTSSLTFTNAGALTIDVASPSDFAQFDGVQDGLSPIIFDADGLLFDELGFDPGVIGFARPDVLTGSTPFVIREGLAVLNGNFIDGDTADGREISLAAFGAVMAHEFGHFLNLGHTQVNGHYFLGDRDDPGFATYGAPPAESVALMFPFTLSIPGIPTGPSTDDVRAISTLYPAGGFPGLFGKIEGTVFESDGQSVLEGANIIARNQADPFMDASSWVSGALSNLAFASTFGIYELNGLTSGASYTVEAVNVNPQFVLGSSVGPVDPPIVLPGPEEFWNDLNESGDPAIDTPSDMSLVVASGTVSDIDIIMNDVGQLIQLDKFDSNTEFILSVQSLITRFNMPNGTDDYAAVRYPIPASVDTPFTVTTVKFFNNDDQTVWPRVLLTAPNGSDQPDLANPLAEVTDVTGGERSLISVSVNVTRTSFEDLFIVVQFPPGEAVSASGSGGGPAIGADAGSVGNGGFEFGYVPGNLFSSDGITFQETNTAADIASPTRSVDAANWEMILEIAGPNLAPDKLEPNNDMGSATAIAYGEFRKASIDSAGELDYFEFTGSAGDTVQADIAAQICGSMLDGFLVLIDANGDTLAQSDDEFVGFGTDPKLQAILPATANYFLIMNSWDNAENNDLVGGPDFFYELRLDTFSPPFEPNNTPAQATAIDTSAAKDAALDVSGDMDFYTFAATNGDFLDVRVLLSDFGLLAPGVASPLSPVLTLFDSDGSTVLATENSAGLQAEIPSDGMYFLAVADLEGGGGADFFYQISITFPEVNLPPPVNLSATGFKDRAELTWQAGTSGSLTKSNLKELSLNASLRLDEIEPNNSLNDAQSLEGASPLVVNGNAETTDAGDLSFVDGAGNPIDDVEDLFVIMTLSPGLNLTLTDAVSDLDLYVIQRSAASLSVVGASNATGVSSEAINLPALDAGTYFIGVTIFDSAPAGPVSSPYTLTVTAELPGSGAALQSFNIYRSETSNAASTGQLVGTTDANSTQFVDSSLAPNTFFYQVTAVYDLGESQPSNEATAVVTSVQDDGSNLPATFALEQNYPNPFNPSTVISYAVPISHNNQRVTLEIFNALGQKVRSLVDEQLSAGFHTAEWDGKNDLGKPVTSGLYLYRIEAGSFIQVKKMLFLK